MITTLKELRTYIKADRERYGYTLRKYIIGKLFFMEYSRAIHLLYNLRLCEYAKNCSRKSPLHTLFYLIIRWNYQRLQLKYNTFISLNTCGYGLYIPHLGGIIVNCKSMGTNCSVTAGVVIGNKAGQDNRAIIGNNCYFTLGCKVIGKVHIGNNCIVCQNSVVVKDVSDNSIVSGVPSKTIKKIDIFFEIKI